MKKIQIKFLDIEYNFTNITSEDYTFISHENNYTTVELKCETLFEIYEVINSLLYYETQLTINNIKLIY